MANKVHLSHHGRRTILFLWSTRAKSALLQPKPPALVSNQVGRSPKSGASGRWSTSHC